MADNGDIETGDEADGAGAPSVSFEFFPPATPEMAYRLWSSATALGPLGPSFVSVTYGAGGTTRRRTLDAIGALRGNAGLNVAGHLTCVGATREETLETARAYKEMGVSRIVALRGDPPKGVEKFEPHPDGFAGAVELIEALAREIGLPMAVSAYPEPHPEASSMHDDVEHLKRKIDAGADMAITQFFFENEDFYRFRDACAAAGVDAPILPGMLPIENFTKMVSFAARCGASVPQRLHELFNKAEDRETEKLLAATLCAEQCEDLIERGGVDHLHFYTLNTATLTQKVCRALGVDRAPLSLAEVG
ncbi:MAG: methylenetetrahydrofolate reductase [NAD(P)H] [Neomegalonema sp.]|nr:methylenetetrahydrofolate reductase [NAD(P)H] [Neomegalonema sp.]